MKRHQTFSALLAFAPLALACGDKDGADDTGVVVDDTGAAGDDTGAEGDDTGAEGHDTGAEGDDTGPTGDDTGAEPFTVSGLAATVHEGMGSILVVSWEQSAEGEAWLAFSVDDGVWMTSPPEARPAGAAEELALGLPFGAAAQVKVVWDGGESEPLTAATDAPPTGAPVATLVEGDAALWDASSPWVLLSLSGATDSVRGVWTIVVDRQGRTVWALASDALRATLHPQLSADGSQILIDQNTFWAIFDYGAAAEIDRVDIEGEVLETIATPGLHHPFTELPDGTLAWGAIDGYFRDESLTTLSPDGDEAILWSCSDFLAAEGGEPGDYCGSNTLSYSEERGSFLYSFFSLETMIEIDAASGETLRYFGHTGREAWDFDPPESAFWWQHGGHFTHKGTMLVSSKDRPGGAETVLREYELDEASEALVEVFSFGEGEGIYGDVMGEADYTAGGNILHNYGSAIRLREITPEGQVAWDVGWDAETLGRSTPVQDLYALKR